MLTVRYRRVVLLGKSGSGKSSLANSLFGEPVFSVNHSSDSKEKYSKTQTRQVDDVTLSLIDTPGIFNTDRSKYDVEDEIISCYSQCAPGPHAFLFVLPIEKFTEQEQAIVDQVKHHFGDDVLKYTTVVFTHGDQLEDKMKINEFVSQSEGLTDLVRKCGGRCHVIDNKYWKNTEANQYRSNVYQTKEILKSIEQTYRQNGGGYFTNEMLREVEEVIQEHIKKSEGLPLEVSRESAKETFFKNYINKQQQRRRFFKHAMIFTGLFFLPFAARFLHVYFRANQAGPELAAGGNELVPTVVLEVVETVVKPVNSTLHYIVQTIKTLLSRREWNLTNNTQTM